MHSRLTLVYVALASLVAASPLVARDSTDPIVCPATRNLAECCTNIQPQNGSLAPLFAPEHPDPNLYAALGCSNITSVSDWSVPA
jgi:hypothetical protein